MLGTVIRLFTGGSDLLGAEARLLMARLARVAMAGAVFALLALVAAAALITLGAGLAGALAPAIGWPLALVTVGGGALVLIGVAALLMGLSLKRAFRPVERPDAKAAAVPPKSPEAGASSSDDSSESDVDAARRDILAAKRRLHRAVNGGRSGAGGPLSADSLREWGIRALDTAVRNPEAALAGAFALATIVGPTRVFRLASRVAGAVSMAATMTRLVKRELAAARASPSAPPRPAGAASGWPRP